MLENEPLGGGPDNKQVDFILPRKSETLRSDDFAHYESLPRINSLRQNSTVDSSKGADYAEEQNNDTKADGIQAGQVIEDLSFEPQLKPIRSL